jgi:hypothetical protein
MAVNYINLFPEYDVAEDGKEGKNSGEGRFAVDYGERDIVDLEAVGEVAYASAVAVGVSDYYYAVATVYEFLLREMGRVSYGGSVPRGAGCCRRSSQW